VDKTIAEMFEEEWNSENIAWSKSIRNAIECIEARIVALEGTEEHGDRAPKDKREWIDVNNDMVWAYWKDGTVILYNIADYLKHRSNLSLTHIMPYREGDTKPEQPEMTK